MKSVMGPIHPVATSDGAALQPDAGPLHPDTTSDGYPSLLTWKSSRLFGAFQGAVEGGTSDGSGGNGATVGTGSDGWYK